MTPREHEPLASHCTLGVGGPARFFIDAHDEADVLAAWRWARARGIPLRILGGGSNLVVADEGVDGLVVRIGLRGLSSVAVGSVVELTAGAGEPWDAVVRHAVERGWAGLECLSGIPGLTGATPIQNVGAYGQEVSDTITAVRALHRERGVVVTLTAADCAFAYRDSMLKSGAPDRYVVLAVTYRLEPDGRPRVRYADLEQHLAARGVATPSLAEVRASILAIRRSKSMVLDPDDPNRRSCGSFFLNPIVSPEEVGRIEARAGDAAMPRWRQADGRDQARGRLAHRARGLCARDAGRSGGLVDPPHPGHRLPRRGPGARRARLRGEDSRPGGRALRRPPDSRAGILAGGRLDTVRRDCLESVQGLSSARSSERFLWPGANDGCGTFVLSSGAMSFPSREEDRRMKKLVFGFLAVAVLLAGSVVPSYADGWHGGGWHGGGWHGGWHGGWRAPVVFVGPRFFVGPAFYYPRPYAYAPPVVVRAPGRGSGAGSAGLHAEPAVLVLLPESGRLLPVGAAVPDPVAAGGAAAPVSTQQGL